AGTWTGEGKLIEEIATMQRCYSGTLICIDSQGGRVSCTPEHPFFVRRRTGQRYPIQLREPTWIAAKDLQQDDYLLVPVIRPKVHDTMIDLREFIRKGADLRGRHTCDDRVVKLMPLDEDTAWLIGLYVAEGSSSPHVRFTLGAHEDGTVNRAMEIMRRIGYSP